jgi:hypothetical protein
MRPSSATSSVPGLAWLRAVRLADVERRLLNAELALFQAVQERIWSGTWQ